MSDLVQRARITYLGNGYWRILAEHERKNSEDRDITELISDMADRIERLENALREAEPLIGMLERMAKRPPYFSEIGNGEYVRKQCERYRRALDGEDV